MACVMGEIFSEDLASIPESFRSIPLTGLSRETRRKLSHVLNVNRIFRSDEGYERDWRGIASFAIPQVCGLEKSVALNEDYFERVLKLWCELQPASATFNGLLHILMKVDRWDVADDILGDLSI